MTRKPAQEGMWRDTGRPVKQPVQLLNLWVQSRWAPSDAWAMEATRIKAVCDLRPKGRGVVDFDPHAAAEGDW